MGWRGRLEETPLEARRWISGVGGSGGVGSERWKGSERREWEIEVERS